MAHLLGFTVQTQGEESRKKISHSKGRVDLLLPAVLSGSCVLGTVV